MTFLTIESQAVAPIVLEQNCFPQELEIDGVADKELWKYNFVKVDWKHKHVKTAILSSH